MGSRSVKVESLEKYYGSIEEVKDQIERCPKCAEKLDFTHLSDHDNMYLHEEVKCGACGWGPEETLHILN